jgi:xanthine dehydrogenase small subunit
VTGRSTIRFLLDGELKEVRDCNPTRTVLQYLREDLHRTGTKEGCAEGDCGACTVVIAEPGPAGNGLQLRAINSCIQFLPTLDGKELYTVESLGKVDSLHAVQKAMVECHASQCGFCTPGFVMSLFALYKNNAQPTRRDIDVALAGNLCRCTGYQPIAEAAKRMYAPDLQRQGGAWIDQPSSSDDGAESTAAVKLDALRSIRTTERLEIDSAGCRFYAPQTLEDCAALLAQNPRAVILAGGTDAGLWVTKQLRELESVIYLGGVDELRSVEVNGSDIAIGAAVSLTDAMQVIVEHYPTLEELFLRFASPPIRNAATLGGNIANGSPIGDSMPALMVLDAALVLRSGTKTRRIGLNDFYLGYQKTALEPGEFVEKILLPLPTGNATVAAFKVSKRFDQDISAVCAAFRLLLDGDTVSELRMACGGMAAVPKRAVHCEAALRGKSWSEANVSAALKVLDQDFKPITDMRSSAAYRREVCANLLYRFFLDSGKDVTSGVYHYGR